MKVKNNASNDVAIGSTVIPRGATVEVEDWDERKDSYPIKKMVDAGALVPASKEAVEDAPDSKVKIMQELDRMKVDYDKRKGAAELAKLLEEENAKATKNGAKPT